MVKKRALTAVLHCLSLDINLLQATLMTVAAFPTTFMSRTSDATAAMTNLQGASDLYAFLVLCSKLVSSSTACLLNRRLLLGSISLDQHVKPSGYRLATLLGAPTP